MVHNKYIKLYYDITTYFHLLNMPIAYSHRDKTDGVLEPYGFRIVKSDYHKHKVIFYDANDKLDEFKLMYTDELVEVHVKARKSNGWGIHMDSLEYKWTNKQTNQSVETHVYWKAMALINGTYKPFVAKNISEQFRHDASIKLLSLSPSDFKSKLSSLEDRYNCDYVADITSTYHIYANTAIKSFTIILATDAFNQISFAIVPSTYEVGTHKDVLTEEIISNVMRFCYTNPFDMFMNDTKTKVSVPPYYEQFYKNMMLVSSLIAFKFNLYESKYKFKFSDTKLRKKIENYTNK